MTAVTTQFSYAALDVTAEQIARSSAAAIRAVTSRAIPEIGRHLLAAKEALPHGTFTAWAEGELGINARSARNYMAAAQWLIGKTETVAALPPTILYALSGPGAPQDVVDDVIAASEAGKPLRAETVRAKLEIANIRRHELRHAEKRGRTPKTAAQYRAEQQLKHEQQSAKQDRQEQLMREQLQPLARRLIALGPQNVSLFFKAINSPISRSVLRDLLETAASGVTEQ